MIEWWFCDGERIAEHDGSTDALYLNDSDSLLLFLSQSLDRTKGQSQTVLVQVNWNQERKGVYSVQYEILKWRTIHTTTCTWFQDIKGMKMEVHIANDFQGEGKAVVSLSRLKVNGCMLQKAAVNFQKGTPFHIMNQASFKQYCVPPKTLNLHISVLYSPHHYEYQINTQHHTIVHNERQIVLSDWFSFFFRLSIPVGLLTQTTSFTFPF